MGTVLIKYYGACEVCFFTRMEVDNAETSALPVSTVNLSSMKDEQPLITVSNVDGNSKSLGERSTSKNVHVQRKLSGVTLKTVPLGKDRNLAVFARQLSAPFNVEVQAKEVEKVDPLDQQRYLQCFYRYSRKRKIYATAAQYAKKLDLGLIVIPMIILQMTATIFPIYFKHSTPNISAAIAAVTAALIGAQAKLRWGTKSEQYSLVSSVYQNLADQCYYQYLHETKDLSQFLRSANSLERQAREGCPNPPMWIENTFRRHSIKESLSRRPSFLQPGGQLPATINGATN